VATATTKSKTKKKKKRKKKADTTTLLHEVYKVNTLRRNDSGIFRGLKNPKSWTLEETT